MKKEQFEVRDYLNVTTRANHCGCPIKVHAFSLTGPLEGRCIVGMFTGPKLLPDQLTAVIHLTH
jgi:hypothetical protein